MDKDNYTLTAEKALVESFLPQPATEEEYKKAIPVTVRKIIRIIDREGTAGGERLKPEYFSMLIAETIIANRFIRNIA